MASVSQSQQAKARRQMRAFVLIWTFITMIMGLATFLAIYFTYNTPAGQAVAAADPSPMNDSAGMVLMASATPQVQPTQTMPPTQEPTTLPTMIPTDVPEMDDATSESVDSEMSGESDEADDTGAVSVAGVEETAEAPPPSPTAEPTMLPVEDEHFQVGIQVQHSVGFNPDFQSGYYETVRRNLGVEWVKQQIPWEIMEPEPDQYNWAITDLIMPVAERFEIKLMLSIVAAPAWAREPGVDTSQHGPPANNQDYVDFVTKLIQRYPGQVHGIEVWNEHNLDREWTSVNGLSAENYTAMFRETVQAVKAIDPGIIMITGALAPTGGFITPEGVVTAIDDFTFMEQQIAAGLLDYADCVGAHHNGYNIPPTVKYDEVEDDPTAIYRGPFDNPHHSWSFRTTLEGYAQRIRNAGYDTPLCVTEFGWAVTEDLDGTPRGFEFADDNTLEEQAQWFPDALSYMEESGFVWLAFIWNFNYGEQAGWDPANDNVPYSLVGPGWMYRPAFDSIRDWLDTYRERTGRS